ncbi:MAG: Ig-like domain-containing protein, partial [Treponema sp.]|nr:Ig-like domain-containing protein [Treponema sp.]
INIPTNSSQNVSAVLQPANATNQAVTWEVTEGSSIITIDSTNSLSITVSAGSSTGSATLKVTTADGSFTEERQIQVAVAPPPTSIGISTPTPVQLIVAGTRQIEYELAPENADTRVTWTSQHSSVATVSNGLITAVGVGQTTITVTSDHPNSTASSSVTVSVSVSSGGVAPDGIFIYDTDGTDITAPSWTGDGDGSFSDPFILSDIFHGQAKELTFGVAGSANANKNVQWQSWSTYGIVESVVGNKVTFRGLNENLTTPRRAQFSISSVADPGLFHFIAFDVTPPNPLHDDTPFAIADLSDTSKHFSHHTVFSSLNQTGNASATPYILGITTGTASNNSLTLTATLKGAGNNIPANTNLVAFIPPASDSIISITQAEAIPKQGSTDEVEIEFTVTAKGPGGMASINVYPEGRLDLAKEIHFRVILPLPASPPVQISPSGPTSLSQAVSSQEFSVSYGSFPDADVAKIEWHVSAITRTGYLAFNDTADAVEITLPHNDAKRRFVTVTRAGSTIPSPNDLRVGVRIWDYYNTISELEQVSRARTSTSGGIISISE